MHYSLFWPVAFWMKIKMNQITHGGIFTTACIQADAKLDGFAKNEA